jgi:hypothetical protein
MKITRQMMMTTKRKAPMTTKRKAPMTTKRKTQRMVNVLPKTKVLKETKGSDEGEDQDSNHGQPTDNTQSQGFEHDADEKEYEDYEYNEDPVKKDHDTIEKKFQSSNEEQEDSFFRSFLDPIGQSPPETKEDHLIKAWKIHW